MSTKGKSTKNTTEDVASSNKITSNGKNSNNKVSIPKVIDTSSSANTADADETHALNSQEHLNTNSSNEFEDFSNLKFNDSEEDFDLNEFMEHQVSLFNLNPNNLDEINTVIKSYGPRFRITEWSQLIISDLEFLGTRDFLYSNTLKYTEEEIIDLALRDFRLMVSERIFGHKYENKGGYEITHAVVPKEKQNTSFIPTQMITSTNKYPTLREVTKNSINTFDLEYHAYVGSTGQGVDKTRWSESVQATIDMYWLMHPIDSKKDWRSEYVISTRDLLDFIKEKMIGKGDQYGHGSPILNLQNSIADEKILYSPHEPVKMNERIVEIKA